MRGTGRDRPGSGPRQTPGSDVAGAAKQVSANVQNRVERLQKDIDNGVNKLRGDKSDKKSGDDKKSDAA